MEYLRKVGTKIVVGWTKAQAAKIDMEPIDEETAKRLITEKQADDKVRAMGRKALQKGAKLSELPADVQAAMGGDPTADVDQMTLEQLQSKATSLKIHFRPNYKKETLVKKIKAALADK